MGEYSVEELEKKYELELDRIINEIKGKNAKTVLVQFPDGLKPYATSVISYLQKKTDSQFFIYLGTCFGACDYPVGLEQLKPKIDLMVQFGHSSLMPSY